MARDYSGRALCVVCWYRLVAFARMFGCRFSLCCYRVLVRDRVTAPVVVFLSKVEFACLFVSCYFPASFCQVNFMMLYLRVRSGFFLLPCRSLSVGRDGWVGRCLDTHPDSGLVFAWPLGFFSLFSCELLSG